MGRCLIIVHGATLRLVDVDSSSGAVGLCHHDSQKMLNP